MIDMTNLTKYQKIKMYLSINGYDTLQQLADDWDVHLNAIRDNCNGTMTSERLDRLTSEFIKNGNSKFKEYNNE